MNNNMMMKYLACHRSCDESVFNYARGISADDVENARNKRDAKIRSMVSAVRMEIHRMRGFVRLTPIGDNALYGHMKPVHNIGEQVSGIMAHRYPGTIIALGNEYKSWVSLYASEGVLFTEGPPLKTTVEKLGMLMGSGPDDGSIEKLWDTYYKSQYRPERRNLAYFHKNMPLASLRSAKSKAERNKSGATLDDYINK